MENLRSFAFTARIAAVLLFGQTLAACATVSFGPPAVRGDRQWADDGVCPPRNLKTGPDLDEDVMGALALVENYRLAYSCASSELANGRQYFEVPSALALAGGAAAAAFGAGPDVAIATGAGSALLNHGKSYYDPEAKAHIAAAALDAVMCIKREASGISDKVVKGDAARVAKLGIVGGNPIQFDPQFQYYQLVSANLQSVHAVLTERLQTVGSFSPTAIADEIKHLSEEAEDAGGDANEQTTEAEFASLGFTSGSGLDAAVTSSVALDELAPKLELCVVRAKSG